MRTVSHASGKKNIFFQVTDKCHRSDLKFSLVSISSNSGSNSSKEKATTTVADAVSLNMPPFTAS